MKKIFWYYIAPAIAVTTLIILLITAYKLGWLDMAIVRIKEAVEEMIEYWNNK